MVFSLLTLISYFPGKIYLDPLLSIQQADIIREGELHSLRICKVYFIKTTTNLWEEN